MHVDNTKGLGLLYAWWMELPQLKLRRRLHIRSKLDDKLASLPCLFLVVKGQNRNTLLKRYLLY